MIKVSVIIVQKRFKEFERKFNIRLNSQPKYIHSRLTLTEQIKSVKINKVLAT